MKVLVGTIIANVEKTAKQWLAVQLAALRSTIDFEHVAVIPPGRRAGDIPAAIEYFSRHTRILTELKPGALHASSLSTLQEHFIERKSEFDCFLFLDSDAFPIRKGWLDTLVRLVTGKRRPRPEIVTLYRPEWGDTRLHASALYAVPSALEKLRFVFEKRGARGDGAEMDTYIDPYTTDWKRTRRLVRTNRINVHPMLAGVYGDIFYHHGCGSRNFNHRSTHWSHLARHSYFDKTISTSLRRELMANPRKFLGQFLWEPSSCALPSSVPPLGD